MRPPRKRDIGVAQLEIRLLKCPFNDDIKLRRANISFELSWAQTSFSLELII